MSSHIYYRLFGQSTALLFHAGNSIAMLIAMQNEELMSDPEIKTMTSMQSRYLTVWNIAFQLAYFSLAFACDFLTVTGRDHLMPKSIKKIRQPFLAGLLWPTTAFIFTFFWPLFIYNRELIFPAFIDKIFSFKSNLIMHFVIMPAAVWEIAFLPRQTPKSHGKNLGMVIILYILYNSVIIHTHSQRGIWPYPLLGMMYGTIWFPIFMGLILVLSLATYYLQWPLSSFFWKNEKTISKRKVK